MMPFLFKTLKLIREEAMAVRLKGAPLGRERVCQATELLQDLHVMKDAIALNREQVRQVIEQARQTTERLRQVDSRISEIENQVRRWEEMGRPADENADSRAERWRRRREYEAPLEDAARALILQREQERRG